MLQSEYIKISVTNNHVFSLWKLYLDMARKNQPKNINFSSFNLNTVCLVLNVDIATCHMVMVVRNGRGSKRKTQGNLTWPAWSSFCSSTFPYDSQEKIWTKRSFPNYKEKDVRFWSKGGRGNTDIFLLALKWTTRSYINLYKIS